MFSQKKFFFIYQEIELFKKKFLNFRRKFCGKKFLTFQEMELSSPKIENFLTFQEGTCNALKTKNLRNETL